MIGNFGVKYMNEFNNYENTPTIETERLILRKFTESDLMDLYEIFRNEEVNTFLPWYPLKTVEEAKIFLYEHYLKYYELDQGYKYAICLKSDNKPIGYLHVSMEESHDLGYGLCKKNWHNGIISEACRALISKLKADGFPYITATHDINNPRSGNVMKNLGMNYQYTYEEQWQPKNKRVTFRLYQLNFHSNLKFVYMNYWKMTTVHFIETNTEKETNNENKISNHG